MRDSKVCTGIGKSLSRQCLAIPQVRMPRQYSQCLWRVDLAPSNEGFMNRRNASARCDSQDLWTGGPNSAASPLQLPSPFSKGVLGDSSSSSMCGFNPASRIALWIGSTSASVGKRDRLHSKGVEEEEPSLRTTFERRKCWRCSGLDMRRGLSSQNVVDLFTVLLVD